MFGIGLPELIVILGIALIVVGPEKLPELAKSLAKQMVEFKNTAEEIKESLNEDMEDQDSRQPEEDIVKLPSETFGESGEEEEEESGAEAASTEPMASSEAATSEESDSNTDVSSS